MDPIPRKSVSIVIRAYNEEKHIAKLLQGILAQSLRDVEIVLVDSGSTDGTVEIAEQFPVKVVHIDPKDFTFGFSLNQGISSCSNELIVIASAHVYPVFPDWLESLTMPFSDPKVALSYGKQRGIDDSKYSERQLFQQWFPDSRPVQQAHPFCNNANAAIRRTLWQQYPYDESLPGLEDLDWAHRLMNQGYSIQYVPDAEIIHIHEESPASIYHRYLREGMAFKRIFPTEQFRFWDFLRLSVSNVLSDWRSARMDRALTRHWKDIAWFRTMQFWGTYQGYKKSGPLTWQLKQRLYFPLIQNSIHTNANQRKVEPIQYN